MAKSENECIFCNETSSTPYYDAKNYKCKTVCDSHEVVYTQENHCLEQCPHGMQKSISGSYCCDENCADCSDRNSRECTECTDKTPFLDLQKKTCVTNCPLGIFGNEKKICTYNKCTNSSFFLDISTKSCVETCPEDLYTFVSYKACVKNCSSIDPTMWGTKNKLCCKIGCEECSYTDDNFCLTCENDYFFFLNTNKCVFNCPPEYTYKLEEKRCVSCKKGIENCDQWNLAKWCKPNFLLNKDSTCKDYCASGNPDPKSQFCCNENETKCQNNQTMGSCDRLRLEKIYSPSMQKNIPFFVLLPQKWDQNKNDTFPVVMILHGNYNSYVRQSLNLTFGCYNEDFLLVFPDGDLNTYFIDISNNPPIKFETFITVELRSFLIVNYRASNDRKWANIGISAGGFGSLAIALKHRDKFCAAASFGGTFFIYDVGPIWDVWMELRFGNKNTDFKNYIPFDIIKIANDTGLQNNELNIFFIYYNGDIVGKLPTHSREFHNFLNSKNISHSLEELEGSYHIDQWEDYIINKFFPFILKAFKNNCE